MDRLRLRTTTRLPLEPGQGTDGLTLRAVIRRTLFAAIASGRLPPASRIPSARELARDWRVSRNTVDEAIAELQAEGLVERRVGSGTFVAPHLPGPAPRRTLRQATPYAREAVAQLSRWGRATAAAHSPAASPRPTAFAASMADLEAFPHALWRRLVARRLRASGRELAGYVPSLGLPRLQRAIARHLALARGFVCEPERILVLNSAMQAADLVARVLVGRGDRVLIEDPTFPNLRAALSLSGASIVPVPVDADGIDVDAAIARAPDAVLAYVTPCCHFPLGIAMSGARRQALLAWARRANAWIVEDDYHSEFVHDARAPAPLAALDPGGRVLYVGSFSATVFPSLRLAYCVLPPSLAATFAAVRSQLDDHTHGLGQAVLADFIDGGHFASHLRRMRELYAARRDALLERLQALPRGMRPGASRAGMSVPLLLDPPGDDVTLAASLAREGIDVLPLSRYAAKRARARGLLLGYAALDEASIARAAARMGQVLHRRRG